MNFTPVACIVCQCEVSASAISLCLKGHQQCQVCSIKLNGVCGICTTPIELQTTATGSSAFVAVLPDTEFITGDVQGFWNPQQLPIGDSNRYFQDITLVEDSQGDERTEVCAENDQNFYNSASFGNRMKEQDYMSASLMDILRTLHEARCSNNCNTFDYCVRQILWQQFDCNQQAYYLDSNENLSSLTIPDMLQSIHRNSCGLQCDNMVCCLSSSLKHLIEEEEEALNAEKVPKHSCESSSSNSSTSSSSGSSSKTTNYITTESSHAGEPEYLYNECNAVIDKHSNVIRACHRNDKNINVKSKNLHVQPQFEVVTTFSTLGLKAQKDFSLPFFFESNAKTASILQCPMLACNMIFEDRYITKHLQEKHKNLELQLMQPNETKLFVIDPSILEYNEVNCIASYMVPNVYKSSEEAHLEGQGLPILVMACRVNLNDLHFQDLSCSVLSERFSDQRKQYAEADEEVIDAEVAETVYGVKRKLRSEPVKWSCEDILVICPVGLIPKQKAVCTSLIAFAPKNSVVNFSASFCLRSMRDFTTIRDLVGSPDTMCLTSVDIAALTSNGQHVIHCQIMCKF